jgi:leucyl aminopeptidase
MKISFITKINANEDLVIVCNDSSQLKQAPLDAKEIKQVKTDWDAKIKFSLLTRGTQKILVFKLDKGKNAFHAKELSRRIGCIANKELNKFKLSKVSIYFDIDNEDDRLAFVEGVLMTNYQFLKYFSDKTERTNSLSALQVLSNQLAKAKITELENTIAGVFTARTLVNEPLSYLTAVQLSKEIEQLAGTTGFKFEYFDKKKITALRMGGLLSVNKGSIDPPTFNILEYKPAKAKNKQPIVLVGKGVVYDTGGLSLKPTPNSMDLMKSDMAGAAAVIGTFEAIVKNKLPLHVIGLIPATDNRPGENAYVPGDVVKMHNGMTVEMLNADAEGRMILADALSYAQQYKPALVIDLATLTGAAVAAIGKEGIVAMGKATTEQMDQIKLAGNNVHERIAEMPYYDEYDTYIKSDIADMKNIGGPTAGCITAGKFLERYTKYNWIHLDIAGTAFLTAEDTYKGKNGTGVGVRLLYDFLKNYN